jgi:hypothetical protein
VPTLGGEEKEVPNAPLLKSGFWAVTAKGICLLDVYGAENNKNEVTVKLFQFDRRGMATLGVVPHSHGSLPVGISVRRDGGAIVWSRGEVAVDLFLVDNLR